MGAVLAPPRTPTYPQATTRAANPVGNPTPVRANAGAANRMMLANALRTRTGMAPSAAGQGVMNMGATGQLPGQVPMQPNQANFNRNQMRPGIMGGAIPFF